MGKRIGKHILAIFFLIVCSSSLAQTVGKNLDSLVIKHVESKAQQPVNSLFKSLLVLDRSIGIRGQVSLNDELMADVLGNIQLEVREVKTIYFPVCFMDYKVYAASLNFSSRPKDIPDRFVFITNICSDYIIVFNEETGIYYRLKGFKTNDFFNLLRDLARENDSLKLKSIVKQLAAAKYDGLDFDCLFDALRDSPENQSKYNCMDACKDFLTVH